MSKRQNKRVAALLVVAMLLTMLHFSGGMVNVKAAEGDKLTIVIQGILGTNGNTSSKNVTVSPGSTKSGWKSQLGSVSSRYWWKGSEYYYTLAYEDFEGKQLPVMVLATEDEGLVTTESAGERRHINKITYNSDGTVKVTFTDNGEPEVLTPTDNKVFISPVYEATPWDNTPLTVVMKNILYNTGNSVNGHAVAYDDQFTLSVNGPGNTSSRKPPFDMVGGANRTSGGLGYDYVFLNAVVLTTEDGEVILADSIDSFDTIDWITYKGNGNVTISFTNGKQTELTDTTTIYISPVYKATASWYLNYYYIDNISTGSGSWSNKDFVVSFSHTFKNPLDYTPRSHYQFLYWEVEETGEKYEAGDTMTYTGAELPQGATKDMYVYAYYQPSVTVRYFYEGNKSGFDLEQFENINIYDYKADHAGLDFAGWYDAEGNLFDESAVAEIPEITKEPVDQKIITVYAHYNASITPEDNTKVYAEEDPELTAKTSGFAENDSVTYELERKAGEDVGEYTISVSDGASATTYTGGVTKYNITTGEAIFKITPKSIIVTADDLSKIYGEEDPELTVTIEGLVVAGEEGNTSDTGEGTSETGEGTPTQEESDPTPNPAPDAEDTEAPESTETAEQTDSTGLITFTITREPGENVGEYEITVTGEELQGNYQVTFVNGTFTIEPKEITVTPEDGTKVYGDKDPDLTATIDGLVEGDSEDLIKYELKRDAGENVGKYTVTASGEEAQGNYQVTFVNGTFTIEPKEITVTPEDGTKVYGDKDPDLTATIDGLLEGESEDLIKYELEREAGENVGKYTVTASGEEAQGNYQVTFVNGTFTIEPKEITVTPEDGTKVYGDKDPDLTATIDGLLEGESEDLIKYELEREAGENVGKYTVTASGEEAQGNYQITFVNGTFTIEPKEITVTPEDGTKVYGDKDPDLTATIDGLVEGDSEDLIKYELERDAGENVGEYKVTASGEEAQGNYLVTYEEGTFTITPREVTVTADSFSKKAGEADPTFTAKAEGLVGSDTVTYTIKREAGEAAGTYKLTPEGETEQGNYTVKYVEGTLTITAVEKTPSGPDTGDHSNVMVLAITMGLSLIGIFAVMILKKEENRRLRRKDHARRAHS